MSATEEAILLTRLVGAKEVVAGLEVESEAMGQLAAETNAVGIAAERTRRRSFLLNQALFTMRRFLYLTTLAAVGLGAASIKWGYDYLSQMQQGQIALGKFMGSNRAARSELDKLFQFTAYTPFQFKDVVSAASMLMRFNINANMTNRILRNVTDALAGTTKATPGGLNRIATALGHMMSMGHATGQVLLQLARDGIPGVYDAVKKYFGLSDAEMHHIGTLGLPSEDVMKAINQYIEHSRLHGLARREALGSLHGLLTTSRDFISRIMGQAEQPGFSRFQQFVAGINVHLQRAGTAIQQGRPVLPALFGEHPGAFGHDVELGISLLKSLYRILTGSIIPAFRIWLNIFQPLRLLLLILTGILGILSRHTTLLKYAMIILFIAMTPKWVLDFWGLLVERVVAARLAMVPYRQGIQALINWMKLLRYYIPIAAMRLYEIWVLRAEYATLLWGRMTVWATGIMETLYLRMLFLQDGIKALWFWLQFRYLLALEALPGVMETVAIASLYMWDALLGPIGLILLLITTIGILYWKWKAFHDIVNETIMFMWHHPLAAMFIPILGPIIAAAHGLMAVYDTIRDIVNLLNRPLRGSSWLNVLGRITGLPIGGGGGGGGFLHGLENFGRSFLPFGGHIPHLAAGGQVVGGGWSWVGESGRELAWMPRGASVIPNASVGNYAPWVGGQFTPNDNRPIQVQLIADGKVLAEVVAAHKDDVRAGM